jgi:Matrixin
VWRTLVLTGLLLGGFVGRAGAFAVTPYKWPQAGLGAPVTITYSYSNLFDGGILNASGLPVSISELRGGVEEAMNVWASVAPLNFVEMPDAGPPVSDIGYDGSGLPQIRIGHHFIDGFGGTKAHAYYPMGGANGLSGDVHFDDADRWATIGTLTNPDILGAALHELGHSLGLDHSADGTAVMYPIFQRMQGPGTGYLTEDDIAGIHQIYGSGVGSVRPLVPEPSTLVLAGCSLAALAVYRFARRRRASHAPRGWLLTGLQVVRSCRNRFPDHAQQDRSPVQTGNHERSLRVARIAAVQVAVE